MAALCALLPLRAIPAQVVPGQGTERLIGTAGIETITPRGNLGLPLNPAAIALDGRWSLGIGAATNAVSDVREQSFSAATRIRRIGLAGRITTRWVRNLFDDPALNAPELRVGSTDYSVGASLQTGPGFAFGFTTTFATTQVLGSAGSGLGFRVGGSWQRGRLTAGVLYGDLDPALEWRTENGQLMRSAGTRRLALGASVKGPRLLGVSSGFSAEWSRDAGYERTSWGRTSLALGTNAFRLLGGVAISSEARRNYRELGAVADIGWFQLQMGMRFGAEPAPGQSFVIGVGVHAR